MTPPEGHPGHYSLCMERSHPRLVEVPDSCTCQPATLTDGATGTVLVMHQIMCASIGTQPLAGAS